MCGCRIWPWQTAARRRQAGRQADKLTAAYSYQYTRMCQSTAARVANYWQKYGCPHTQTGRQAGTQTVSYFMYTHIHMHIKYKSCASGTLSSLSRRMFVRPLIAGTRRSSFVVSLRAYVYYSVSVCVCVCVSPPAASCSCSCCAQPDAEPQSVVVSALCVGARFVAPSSCNNKKKNPLQPKKF